MKASGGSHSQVVPKSCANFGDLGSAVSSPSPVGRSPSQNRIWCILALKYDNLVATILVTFPRMNLPNFLQFKRYQGKSGTRVLLFKARFFFFYFPQPFSGSILLPPVNGVDAHGCTHTSRKRWETALRQSELN